MQLQALIILVQNTVLLAQIYYISKAPVWRQTALIGILVLGLSLCLSGTCAAAEGRQSSMMHGVSRATVQAA